MADFDKESRYSSWALKQLRDRSLFMTGGAPEEKDILREHFSRPTRRAANTFRGPLDITR